MVDGLPKKAKSPLNHNSFKSAITDLELVQKYWKANPDHLVGVYAGDKLNVLDVDIKPGSNGFKSLEDQTIPETWSQGTPSGGRHYVYRGQPGLTPTKTHNGMPGVDRRAGESYFIAYSDQVPLTTDVFKTAPEFLTSGKAPATGVGYDGSVLTWLEDHGGKPALSMYGVTQRFPALDFGHSEMIAHQTAVVSLGAEGHAGAAWALDMLKGLWLRGRWDTPENLAEWNTALEGAVAKFGGTPPMPENYDQWETPNPVKSVPEVTVEDELELAVQAAYVREKALLEAKRRIASETYVGSEEMTIADLRVSRSTFIVEDLLPHDGVCFLVAKNNIGKTFTYIDLVMHQVFGMHWLGKATTPTKTLIVLGEGHSGFIDRLDAWADFYGKTEAEWSPWLSFIRGANLNNDESISRIKTVADREEVGLIIFDTWANVSGALSEDDAALNSITMNRALAVRPGVTNLFIHHPRKSDEDTDHPVMRGSGALAGRADVVMTMYRDRKYSPRGGEKQEWLALSTDNDHAGKNRHAQTETIQGLYLEEHEPSAVFMRLKSESVSKGARVVLDHLTDKPTTLEDFHKACGKSESTARRYLDAAVKEGVAHYAPPASRGGSGMWWKLPQEPRITNWSAVLAEQGPESKRGA
jgi:hypothetical protein